MYVFTSALLCISKYYKERQPLKHLLPLESSPIKIFLASLHICMCLFVLNFLKRDFFMENSDNRAHIEQSIRNILALYTYIAMGTDALYAFLLMKQTVLYSHVKLRTNIHIYKTLNPK